MATIRAARRPPPSAICSRAPPAWRPRPKLRPAAAARPEVAIRRAPAGPRVRAAPQGSRPAGPTTAPPAPASPARRSPQISSREKETCSSYFGPVADQVVIDAGQFDRFRVIAPQPLHKGLDRGIEIEDQATGVRIPYHALEPEKRRNPHAPGDRGDQMQTRGRIEHKIPGRELDFVGTVEVLDHQLAPVILVRLRQKQRHRQVGP